MTKPFEEIKQTWFYYFPPKPKTFQKPHHISLHFQAFGGRLIWLFSLARFQDIYFPEKLKRYWKASSLNPDWQNIQGLEEN